jgi:hypothetical protein
MATRFEIGYFVGLLVGEARILAQMPVCRQPLNRWPTSWPSSAGTGLLGLRHDQACSRRCASWWARLVKLARVLLLVSRESSTAADPARLDSYLTHQLAHALDRLQGPGGDDLEAQP